MNQLQSRILRIASDLPAGDPTRREILAILAANNPYSGNPGGKPIYDHKIDHGYEEPLSGGTDVMRRMQNQFRKEQGLPERPTSTEVPKG
jgi:hypothetical protein